MRNFIITNIAFILGMIGMIYYHVEKWYYWVIFIVVWGIADYYFAKDIHLKWWHWVLLISALSLIDFIVIKYVR